MNRQFRLAATYRTNSKVGLIDPKAGRNRYDFQATREILKETFVESGVQLVFEDFYVIQVDCERFISEELYPLFKLEDGRRLRSPTELSKSHGHHINSFSFVSHPLEKFIAVEEGCDLELKKQIESTLLDLCSDDLDRAADAVQRVEKNAWAQYVSVEAFAIFQAAREWLPEMKHDALFDVGDEKLRAVIDFLSALGEFPHQKFEMNLVERYVLRCGSRIWVETLKRVQFLQKFMQSRMQFVSVT